MQKFSLVSIVAVVFAVFAAGCAASVPVAPVAPVTGETVNVSITDGVLPGDTWVEFKPMKRVERVETPAEFKPNAPSGFQRIIAVR